MSASLALFGAGASYGSDVASNTPPLGPRLFQALKEFNPPGWGTISGELAALFNHDFEHGMQQLSQSSPYSLPPLQRAMAAFFFRYAPGQNNLYIKLAQRVRQNHWGGSVATLNYERLCELSISSVGLRPVVGQQTQPGISVEMCFPHGCCHLFCESARGLARNVSFAGSNVQTSGPIVVISDSRQFSQRIQTDAFPPVMSYYEPYKTTSSGANFILAQRERWRILVQQANEIAVIGLTVRPVDAHIWGPLAEFNGSILYCAGPKAALSYQDWQRANRQGSKDTILQGYFGPEFDRVCAFLGM